MHLIICIFATLSAPEMKYLTSLLPAFFCLVCSGQAPGPADSLFTLLHAAGQDTVKLSIIWKLDEIYSRNNYAEAIRYAEQGLAIAEKNRLAKDIIKAHNLIGNNLMFLGSYEQALTHYLEAMSLLQQHKDNDTKLAILNNLGTLQDRLGNYDKALDYFFQALALYNQTAQDARAHGNLGKIPGVYNNIGNIYFSKNELDSAGKYYLQGLDIASKNNDLYNLGILYNNLGRIESKRKHYPQALNYLLKSVSVRSRRNDKSGLAVSYYYLADYYITQKDYVNAERCAIKSLSLGKELNSLITIQTASSFLASIYEQTGQYRKAMEFEKINKTTSDSLLNQRTISDMTRIQMQYEYNLKEKVRQVEDQKNRLKNLLVFSGLGLGLVIVGLLFFLSKSRADRMQLLKEKLEGDVETKNKELTTNVIYLVKKNELINTVINRLLKLQYNVKEENKKSVQEIIFDLQSGVDKEVWEEFEYRFQQVHTIFYEKLQQRFPDLSPAEKKLAALLRLNMTSKDISAITGQSVKSLEVARYRLRKKFNIANTETNLVTFLSEL